MTKIFLNLKPKKKTSNISHTDYSFLDLVFKHAHLYQKQ